jgi:hypothetical protein
MKQFRGLEKSGKFELPLEEVMKVKRYRWCRVRIRVMVRVKVMACQVVV